MRRAGADGRAAGAARRSVRAAGRAMRAAIIIFLSASRALAANLRRGQECLILKSTARGVGGAATGGLR